MKSRFLALVVICALVFGISSRADAGFEWAGDTFESIRDVFVGDQSAKVSDVRYQKATVDVAETDLQQGSFKGDGSRVENARGDFCERWDGNEYNCSGFLSEYCFDTDGDGEAGNNCVQMQDLGNMSSLGLYPKSQAKDCNERVEEDPRDVVCPISASNCDLGTAACAICVNSNGIGACDGRDNNCNGSVDEESEWSSQRSSHSNSLQDGVCAGTYQACDSGAWVDNFASVSNYSETDSCDGLDNDCDGAVDEEPDASESCGSGKVCNGGTCCADTVGQTCSRQSGNTCYENGTYNCSGQCAGGTVVPCVCRYDSGIFDSCVMQ